MIEEAKKKKKRKKRNSRRNVFAAFYGVGDGTSGATFPAFRAPNSGDSSPNPAYPGEGGINSPSVPAGPNAGMGPIAASKDAEIKTRFGNILSLNKYESTQVFDKNADNEIKEGSKCRIQDSIEFSPSRRKKSIKDSSKPLKSEETKLSKKLDKTSMNESLLNLNSIILNRKQLSRQIHDYFSTEKDASDTRDLFIEFVSNSDESADIVQVEKLVNGCGRFRVRLDNSEYRLVFAGRILEGVLFVQIAWIFSYKKDKSYKIFLKNNDYDLSESTHICLVCANTGKILKKDCPLCSHQWKTRRFQFNKKEPQPAMFIGDPTQMKDVDKGWDIDLGIW